MKLVLKLEEFAMWFIAALVLYASGAELWWYLLLFLAPDAAMVGYLVSNKLGAWLYNIAHHKGIALLLVALGILLHQLSDANTDFPVNSNFVNAGLALFGHASMDRFFGYGLKYENGFKFTHLGEIGKK